ncbi:unnamed protein product [Strongylus vulgaris]|uniref:Uncharacterized protein n=1 Tax=Strongylus vulgaris TaxID=40348 RepID=A0A3P7JMH2_STRVU|nr:unnamed protein product [Strongylus vulgaris]
MRKSASRSSSKSVDEVRSPPSSGEDVRSKKKTDDRAKDSSEKRRARVGTNFLHFRGVAPSRVAAAVKREEEKGAVKTAILDAKMTEETETAEKGSDLERGVEDRSPASRRRREKSPEKKDEQKKAEEKAEEEKKEKKEPLDLLRTRTGGAYIPPAKLRMLQDQIQDKVILSKIYENF